MINLHKLTRHRRKQYEKQRHIFHQILKKCHSKIYLSGAQLKTECIFVIPQYVPGMPLFNIQECMKYIIAKLQKNQLAVKILNHDTLSISWDHIDVFDCSNSNQTEIYPNNQNHSKQRKQKKANKTKQQYQTLSNKPIYSIHSYSKWMK